MAPKPPPYHGTADATETTDAPDRTRPTDTVNTDRYAAESNTWRRPKNWQIIGIIVSVIIFALLVWLFLE